MKLFLCALALLMALPAAAEERSDDLACVQAVKTIYVVRFSCKQATKLRTLDTISLKPSFLRDQAGSGVLTLKGQVACPKTIS
jgi:hypothetical protein